MPPVGGPRANRRNAIALAGVVAVGLGVAWAWFERDTAAPIADSPDPTSPERVTSRPQALPGTGGGGGGRDAAGLAVAPRSTRRGADERDSSAATTEAFLVEVVDPEGRPIAGALVQETTPGSEPVTADARGQAHVPRPSAPLGWVVARSNEHLTERVFVERFHDPTLIVRIELAPAIVMRGRVRRSDGAPVEHVLVEFDPSYVSVRAAGDSPDAKSRIVYATDQPGGSDDPRGGSVGAAFVSDARRATTDAAGRFSLPLPEARPLLRLTDEVVEPTWGTYQRSAWFGVAPAAGEDGVAEFVLDPTPPARGGITATTVDAAGRPVRWSEVLLYRGSAAFSAASAHRSRRPVDPRVERDGLAGIVADQLPDDVYRIQIYAEGFIEVEREVRIVGGNAVELGAVALERGARVSGRVEWPPGHEAPDGLSVQAQAVPATSSWASASVMANGDFEFLGLRPGRYRLAFESTPRPGRPQRFVLSGDPVLDVPIEGLALTSTYTLTAAAVLGVHVFDGRLPSAGVAGTEAERAFAARCVLSVVDARGVELLRATGAALRDRAEAIEARIVAPGTYRVRWVAGDDPVEERDVEVVPTPTRDGGSSPRVDVDFAAGKDASVGRVTHPACGAGKCG